MPGHWRRRFHRMRRRVPAGLLPVLLTAVVSAVFFWSLSCRLEPILEVTAVTRAKNTISLAISEEIDESLSADAMTYGDFVAVEKDSGGRISSLSFQTAQSNRFKREVIARLTRRLRQIGPEELSISMGNLTGVLLLSAVGPDIRVNVQSVGDVTAKYENEFTSAGVNQTRHSVYLDVSVTLYLLIPGKIIPVRGEERVCVAETVIVGQVPDTYLSLQDGAD